MNDQFLYIFGAGASAGNHSSYGNESSTYHKIYKPQEKVYTITQVLPTIYKLQGRVEVISYKLHQSIKFITRSNKSQSLILTLNDFFSKTVVPEIKELAGKLLREPFADILAETIYKSDKLK